MIIFDSSTLILLAKAGLLDDFLRDYQGKFFVPLAVEAESCSRKKTFDSLLLRKRIEEGKIKVAKVVDNQLCEQLMQDFNLARGEAETLVLAIEKKAKLVATDDRNAIKACRVLKLSYASAINILIRMAGRGAIEADRLESSLSALLKCGRYSDEIIHDAKKKLQI